MTVPLREQQEYHYTGASHWRKKLLQLLLKTDDR